MRGAFRLAFTVTPVLKADLNNRGILSFDPSSFLLSQNPKTFHTKLKILIGRFLLLADRLHFTNSEVPSRSQPRCPLAASKLKFRYHENSDGCDAVLSAEPTFAASFR